MNMSIKKPLHIHQKAFPFQRKWEGTRDLVWFGVLLNVKRDNDSLVKTLDTFLNVRND